jgi:peptidoglycan/LPS O-acetylase OafA/YrhL
MNKIKNSGFRNGIQFLRALAVLAIVIFHIDKKYLPSGFIGVDIFFVISGFLISGQIFKKLNQNNFSLSTFYLKLIRQN